MRIDHSLSHETRQAQAGSLRAAGAAALGACALFTTSLIGFAQARVDGYSHGTKAVSELGAIGAPNALAFNLAGFILPGVLIAVAAALVARAARSTRGMAPLALAGVSMALAGVFPIDMSDRASLVSQAHLAAAVLTGLFWALALFRVPPTLRAAGQAGLARFGGWLAIALLVNIFWQIAYGSGVPILPGWGQRIGFAGMMIWLAWLGAGLLRTHARQSGNLLTS